MGVTVPDGVMHLSDSSAEDRSNLSHHRRELEQGESSRTRKLTAQVERMAYNLRPRKVDPATEQRRSEFEKRRKQKKQKRDKQKAEDFKSLCDQIKIMMDALPEDSDEDDKDPNRTEILNADESALTKEWRPYFSGPDIGYSCTLKGASWEVEKLALQAAPSVVALRSSTGEDKLYFSCSGTIVEVLEGNGFIVTVANLVKCEDADEVFEELKIEVYLQNGRVLDGDVLHCDFNYNICVIGIKWSEVGSSYHLTRKSFDDTRDVGCLKDVVALGRDRRTCHLLVSTGMITPKVSELDCEELLVSTCRISKEEVGGPLMDFDGHFIGMNYYDTDETPFIPCSIVSMCLWHLKTFGKVSRPWLGLRVRTLYANGGANGVIIKKIEKESSAEASGLTEGDIINRVNGIHFSSAAELGGILLDIGARNANSGDDYYVKFGVRDSELEGRIVIRKSVAAGGLNRWPFPVPIIVRYYSDGVPVRDAWFKLEY